MSQYTFRSILTAVSGASCYTPPHTHTHTHTDYSVQHKLLQNSTDTCPVSNVHILGRKKVIHNSQILLNTTQTAFGIMYAINYVTCIYISLSTTQACSHTHAHTNTHTHTHTHTHTLKGSCYAIT